MSDWPLVALGDIFEIARGGSPRPIHMFITDDPAGVNWIMIGDASETSKYIDKTKKRIRKSGVSKSRMVYPGDFLLTNSMSFGHPYILRTTGCIHDGWLVLTSRKDNVDHDYFYHLLGSKVVYSEFQRLAAGAVVKNLNIDLVKSVQIPLPPLTDQKRIAAILDKANDIRQKRQQAIKLAEDFLLATFLDLYNSTSKQTTYSFSDLAIIERNSFVNGPFGSNLLTSELTPIGVPVIYIRDIRDGIYNRISTAFVSKEKADELNYCNVVGGDILMAKVGDPPGIAAVYPCGEPDAIVTQDVIRIRPDLSKIRPNFFVQLINSSIGIHLLKPIIVEATRSRIGLGQLKSLHIDIPPIDIQKMFEKLCRKIRMTQQKHAASEKNGNQIFNCLAQRAFRGEL